MSVILSSTATLQGSAPALGSNNASSICAWVNASSFFVSGGPRGNAGTFALISADSTVSSYARYMYLGHTATGGGTADWRCEVRNNFPTPTASYTYFGDSIAQVHDQIISYNDSPRSRWTSYETPNASDWIQSTFAASASFSTVSIAVYSDGGGVQVPTAVDVQWWNGSSWVSCTSQVPSNTPVLPNALHTITFDSVTTTQMRVVLTKGGSYPQGTGVSEITYGTNGNFDSAYSGSLSLSTWYHIALTRAASGALSFYVNGALTASKTSGMAVTAFPAWTSIQLGPFNGTIQDATFYASELTAPQVQMHMRARSAIPGVAAFSRYPLAADSSLVDFSGNARTLTATGSPTSGTLQAPTSWYLQASSKMLRGVEPPATGVVVSAGLTGSTGTTTVTRGYAISAAGVTGSTGSTAVTASTAAASSSGVTGSTGTTSAGMSRAASAVGVSGSTGSASAEISQAITAAGLTGSAGSTSLAGNAALSASGVTGSTGTSTIPNPGGGIAATGATGSTGVATVTGFLSTSSQGATGATGAAVLSAAAAASAAGLTGSTGTTTLGAVIPIAAAGVSGSTGSVAFNSNLSIAALGATGSYGITTVSGGTPPTPTAGRGYSGSRRRLTSATGRRPGRVR